PESRWRNTRCQDLGLDFRMAARRCFFLAQPASIAPVCAKRERTLPQPRRARAVRLPLPPGGRGCDVSSALGTFLAAPDYRPHCRKDSLCQCAHRVSLRTRQGRAETVATVRI